MRFVSERAWAVMTIWQEARGEIFDGKVAVGEVIVTRMTKRYSSDGTVEGTVLRPLQFSGWNTKDPNRISAARLDTNDIAIVECDRAWTRALAGSAFTKGAVLYCNLELLQSINQVPPWIKECREVARVGHHTFYVPKGKGWD